MKIIQKFISLAVALAMVMTLFTGGLPVNAETAQYTVDTEYCYDSGVANAYSSLVAAYGENLLVGKNVYGKTGPFNDTIIAKSDWANLTDGNPNGSQSNVNISGNYYPTMYFELDGVTRLTQLTVFNYISWGADLELYSFDIFVSDSAATLWADENLVVDYDVEENAAQYANNIIKFEFSETSNIIGKYVGIRYNDYCCFRTKNGTNQNYSIVLSEIALFGEEIKYTVDTEYCYDSGVSNAYASLISAYGENLLAGKAVYGKTAPFDDTIIAKSDWANLTDGNPNGSQSNVNISGNYYPTMYFELDAVTRISQLAIFNYISWGTDLELCSFDVFLSDSVATLWSDENLAVNYDVEANTAQYANNIIKIQFAEAQRPVAKYVGIRWNDPYNFRDGSSGVVLSEIALFGTEYATVTATAGENGSISPIGETVVNKGNTVTYTITPDDGYIVSEVLVDGVSVGAVSSYTFENISGTHTISATFALPITITNQHCYDSGVTGAYTALTDAYGENLAAGAAVYAKTSANDVSIIEKSDWSVLTDGNAMGEGANVNISANTYDTLYIELDRLTRVSQLSVFNYISWGADLEIASFDVFMSDTVETLWDDSNLIVDYDVSENTAEYSNNIIKIAFGGGAQRYAKYIGIRWNAPYNFREGSVGVVLSEIAVFGTEYNAVSVKALSGGTVSPSGIQAVGDNGSISINATPDIGYGVYDITVDGVSVGNETQYELTGITSDKSIKVDFYKIGDLNRDDMILAGDVAVLRKLLLGSALLEKEHTADINTDGNTDIRDLVMLKKMFVEGKNYVSAVSFAEQYEGAALLSVDNSIALTDDFMYSGLYLGWGAFPDIYGRTYTEEELQQELDTLQKMGYDNLRVSLSTSFAQSEYNNESGDWNWNGDEFKTFVHICKELSVREIELTLTLMWDMEHNLTSAGVYVADDYEQTTSNYAEYCYKLLTTLKDNGVDNVKYILPFVEPYPSKDESELFSGKYSHEIWRDMVAALDAKLKAENVRDDYKIVGPASTLQHMASATLNAKGFTVESWAQWYIDNCGDVIDIYAYHLYDKYTNDIEDDTYAQFYADAVTAAEIFRATGKSVWFDEYNFGYKTVETDEDYSRVLKKDPLYGTHLAAEQITLMNCGISNTMLWSIYDTIFPDNNLTNASYENGIQKTGVLPAASESSTPYYAYYAVSLLSKYLSVGKGTESYLGGGADGVYVSAIRSADGTFTVVAVNTNTTEKTFDLSLESVLSSSDFYRHLYDPAVIECEDNAQIIGVDTVITDVTNRIVDTLPAGGVAIYTTDMN